eukprot:XP_011666884.1 PREDICTED: interferon alpha-inducible protein 27-like protein 2B [Strongylocentrotus purpuratus]
MWVAGTAAAVAVATPIVLTAVGFTTTGIAAGSFAATMMSYSATASGGGVVAGGLVATLQAAGAAGYVAPTVAVHYLLETGQGECRDCRQMKISEDIKLTAKAVDDMVSIVCKKVRKWRKGKVEDRETEDFHEESSANAGVLSDIVRGVGTIAAAAAAAPVVLTAVGCTSSGTAAGLCAAGMMSAAAITGVGEGVVAGLQAAGAAGYVAPTVGSVAGVVATAFYDN